MMKITVGRTRKKSKLPDDRNAAADSVFVVGAVAVCIMLALPLIRSHAAEKVSEKEDVAVMVMSGAVTTEREELVAPSNTDVDEEWSFYDYIGELFAGLLSGR